MMGQELMKRLHARSEWQNLYLCGDSTVMGVGMAATTVSGVGAANMVLRDLGKEEYRPRKFSRDYIRLVKGKPWTPAPDRSEPITPDLAAIAARECQLCEDAPCVEACPTSIDVLNFARRIEAGNFNRLDRKEQRLLFVEERDEQNRLTGILISDRSDPDQPFTVVSERGSFSFDAENATAHLRLEEGDIHFAGR